MLRLRNLGVQLSIDRAAGDESTAVEVDFVEAEAETPSRSPADKPDIGVPNEAYAMARMEDEITPYLIHSMSPEGACKALISDPEDLMKSWATVTRGNPPAHLLPVDQLPAAGLTQDTWYVDIEADPYVEHPHVRSPAEVQIPLKLDMASLQALGEAHGTVTVMKAMQCLNLDQPLGQGVWEGVPLSTVLRQCGRISNCRRIYYWGYHNNDEKQVFRSSISYTEAFEPVPGEPPVFLAYKLNGKPLPLAKGGPVRMIIPHGYGYKNVKFLQHIRCTNDYRANDTYAAIDEGEEGNDPAAVQKTYTTVDRMIGAPPVAHGTPIQLSGVLMNGRTKCSHLEYWVRGPFAEPDEARKLTDDDEELLAALWIRFEVPAPPPNLETALPAGIVARDIFGVDDAQGQPSQWPLPFSYSSWQVSISGLVPGHYEIRARTVDVAGNQQPQPRPYHKNGRNTIGTRRVHVI